MSSYFAAHMDVIAPLPVFNLYNFQWPIYTTYGPQPPAKLVRAEGGTLPHAEDAVLSPGVVVTGGRVYRSVVSPAVRIEQNAEVSDSILMHDVRVGAGAIVRNAILDKNVVVPPGRPGRRRPRGGPGPRLHGRGRPDGARQGPAVPVLTPEPRGAAARPTGMARLLPALAATALLLAGCGDEGGSTAPPPGVHRHEARLVRDRHRHRHRRGRDRVDRGGARGHPGRRWTRSSVSSSGPTSPTGSSPRSPARASPRAGCRPRR